MIFSDTMKEDSLNDGKDLFDHELDAISIVGIIA